ncbi:MAG: signal recognition particle-docking protein FtsY [Deltaproteobacteria bacterium]|nr:MAG: signal recognition particle-docking protein FtsY [Deltaproteobacteria bacterium]
MAEKSFFKRLKQGLKKSRQGFISGLDFILAGRTKIDDELIEELEEFLITSDIGVTTTQKIIEGVKKKKGDNIRELIKKEIMNILLNHEYHNPIEDISQKPKVIMVVGVNGTGKTTTIAKLGKKAINEGKKVIFGAADTFRAAGIEQLSIWGKRVGADIIHHKEGADPSAVAFDTVSAGLSRGADLVFIDTAGRLHTKVNLMEELKKVKRVIGKKMEGAPHEILLVMDATTGQNGIAQAREFHNALGLTGIVMTKLDGTAKGGVLVCVAEEVGIPVLFIGIGENMDDLKEFSPNEFVEALFED